MAPEIWWQGSGALLPSCHIWVWSPGTETQGPRHWELGWGGVAPISVCGMADTRPPRPNLERQGAAPGPIQPTPPPEGDWLRTSEPLSCQYRWIAEVSFLSQSSVAPGKTQWRVHPSPVKCSPS